jgi:hypothetical protein
MLKIIVRRKANGRTIISLICGTMMVLSLEFPSGSRP